MFDLDPRLQARLRQSLKRVLILEENPAYARMLSDMVRVLGADQITVMGDDRAALDKMELLEPQLILSEYATAHINGIDFTRSLRRSDGRYKAVPLIMMKADITPQQLTEARNCGVHEMLSKPFAWQDLVKRLQNVLFKPRDWIEVASYTGPDRRRFNTGTNEYKGPKKRRNEAGTIDRAALEDAVGLLKAALPDFERDAQAAMPLIMQQMAVIVPACKGTKAPRFLAAVQAMIADIRNRTVSRQSLEPQVDILMQSLGLVPPVPENFLDLDGRPGRAA